MPVLAIVGIQNKAVVLADFDESFSRIFDKI
jgi:hypothetical protein